MSTFRDSSRENWNTQRTVEHINAGSLQRIADACELMAKNYAALIDERNCWKRWHDEEQERRIALERKNAALRGVITKLKKGPKP